MKYFLFTFCFIFTLFFSTYTIKQNPEAERAAEKSARTWLELTDSGKYAESWEAAAQFFKEKVDKKVWIQQLNNVRKPLGKVIFRKIAAKKYITKLPEAPKGEYVVIQYETSFENRSFVVETITPMLEEDGKWKVSGYYIK